MKTKLSRFLAVVESGVVVIAVVMGFLPDTTPEQLVGFCVLAIYARLVRHDTTRPASTDAEVLRLREALEEIAAYDEWYCHITTGARMECKPEHTDACLVSIARAALTEGETE